VNTIFTAWTGPLLVLGAIPLVGVILRPEPRAGVLTRLLLPSGVTGILTTDPGIHHYTHLYVMRHTWTPLPHLLPLLYLAHP
jgi:hypothetical protein